MSYHRGGHSGAVAVSYSTMSPLSPIRRYSGSAGSGTSVTSSTNGTTNSAYSNYRSTTPSNSGSERNGGYYTSASNVGHRSSTFGLSRPPETLRRVSYSPARSVSSYNESSSIVGSSSISGSGFRYGSVSSSSASSSAGSSNSSCTSRERNTSQQHHTLGSSATTAADLYALYSPAHYIPNISGSSFKSSNGSASNWRSSSLASSSGVSSSLHGGDEYDSCRERRERSYSSETSSGICLSSNNTSSSSNNQNLVGLNNDRWTTGRDVNKRRGGTPLISTSAASGSNNLISANANKTEIGSSTIEVTLEPEDTSRKFIARRDNELPLVTINVPLDYAKNETILNPEINRTTSLDSNPEPRERFVYNARDNDYRDLDNNNTESECKYGIESRNSNDHTDANDQCDTLETRCGRRRLTIGGETLVQTNSSSNHEPRYVRPDNDHDDDDDDGNHDANRAQNNSETVEPHNRDNSDDSNVRERGIIKENTRESYRVNNHHHQRKRHSKETTSTDQANNRNNDLIIPSLTSRNDNSPNNDSNHSSKPLSSSVASLAPLSTTSFISQPTEDDENPPINNPPVFSLLSQNVEPENHDEQSNPSQSLDACSSVKKVENIDKHSKRSVDSNDCDVAEAGGGGDCGRVGGVIVVVGSSADADNHRKAFTRTKIATNNDNTELLTNNNVQDREDHLGIVETTRRIGNQASIQLVDESRLCDRQMVKGARKSLIWTATSPVDDDEAAANQDNNVLTNGDESQADTTNGFDKSNRHDSCTSSRDYDADENPQVSASVRNGLGSTGNRSDEVEKASTSRRTLFAWNDSNADELTGAASSSSSSTAATASSSSSSTSSSSSSAATSSSNATNSVPVAVHQNIYRGINDQIDENSRPPRSRLQFRKDERYGLNGLRNIGNTCFMNSVIQCLSNTRPLLEYLLNEQHLQDINTTTSSMKGALIKAFGQVIQELWEMSGDHVVNTTALKSQIQRFAPRFMGYSQQDAQEFLRYLLEGLHEDVNRVTVKPQPILTDIPDHYSDSHKASESWKRYLRSEDSTIVDVFVGQLRSSLLCTACDHVSVTLDPFWDLSLPIPMRLGTVKLNQCLEHFTKVETLDGDEKPTCSKCQMRRKCTKSFSIQKFPKILVIHLKRFSPTERFRGKLSVLVDFPLTGLDLSAFAAPGVQGCTYNLYGVANHSGTTYSGHYTAYCKHPYSGEWHEYNDSRVSSVPARSVVSSEAYVLFYEQQQQQQQQAASPHL